MTLLTVTCEVLAQKRVIGILDKHGISGYTIYEVGGKGERGVRGEGIPEEKNVKIEVVLARELAEKVIEEVSQMLFADYAIILYVTDVQVARAKKFDYQGSSQ